MKAETYFVRVERPNGVSVSEMQEYIEEAVDAWRFQMCPDEPLYRADIDFRALRATVRRAATLLHNLVNGNGSRRMK